MGHTNPSSELPRTRTYYESLTWPAAQEQTIDFLLAVYQHYSGKAAVSALDIGCGAGAYTRLLAARDLAVTGLEDDPAALEEARQVGSPNADRISWQLSDLRHFALSEAVDLAVCLRQRFTRLLSIEDLIRHFNAVANALTPRGIYIVELPHPRDNLLVDHTPRVFRGESAGVRVERRWPVGEIAVDWADGVIRADEALSVERDGRALETRTAAPRRVLSAQEMTLLPIQSESMRLVALYGDFDREQPFDDADTARRMVAVLQKVEIPLSYLSPKLQVRPSHEKGDGFGIFAREKISRDEFLLAYGGQVVTREQLQALANDPHQYSLQIEEDLFLTSKGTLADYVNHSCDPNAGMYGATMLAAMRDIEPGEEVCWDYAMSDGSPYDEFECTCQAPNCRHKVTGGDWRIPALWERYAGYFSPYLQRRIDRLRAEQEQGER